MSLYSAGAAFRKAMQEESPLQVIGAINANHALLAKRAGFKAIYLSGGGVAAGSLGLPDLGISNLDDVLVVKNGGRNPAYRETLRKHGLRCHRTPRMVAKSTVVRRFHCSGSRHCWYGGSRFPAGAHDNNIAAS